MAKKMKLTVLVLIGLLVNFGVSGKADNSP